MRFYKRFILLTCIILPLGAMAQIRYSAPLDGEISKKLWSTQDSKLVCRLIHDIPGFGHADFKTYAGRQRKSSLEIYPKLGINQPSSMRFIATKPEWQSGGREELLGKVDLYNGFNPYAGATLSWKILSALNDGKQVLMPYTDEKRASGQNIIPTLSPLGFKKPYDSYLNCQQNLLKVNYSDVQMLPLAFLFRTSELTKNSQERLKSQIEYIKQDASVKKITIKAYAYEMPNRAENIKVAEERGLAIKAIYTAAGIKEEIIEIEKFNSLTLPRAAETEGTPEDHSITSRSALILLERDSSLIDRELDANVPDVGAETGEY